MRIVNEFKKYLLSDICANGTKKPWLSGKHQCRVKYNNIQDFKSDQTVRGTQRVWEQIPRASLMQQN